MRAAATLLSSRGKKNYQSRGARSKICEEAGRTRKAFSWKARTRGARKREGPLDPSAFWASIIFGGIGFFVGGQTTINKCRFYGCQIGHLKYIRVLPAVGSASSRERRDPSFGTGAYQPLAPPKRGFQSAKRQSRVRFELSNLYIAFIEPMRTCFSFKLFGFDITDCFDSADCSNFLNFTIFTAFELIIYFNYIVSLSWSFWKSRRSDIRLYLWPRVLAYYAIILETLGWDLVSLISTRRLSEVPISGGRNNTRNALLRVVSQSSRFLWKGTVSSMEYRRF